MLAARLPMSARRAKWCLKDRLQSKTQVQSRDRSRPKLPARSPSPLLSMPLRRLLFKAPGQRLWRGLHL